ncbi:hypothetical protein ACWGTI_32060 [Mesorhizobium sp. ArgA1]
MLVLMPEHRPICPISKIRSPDAHNDPASFEQACSIPWTLVSEEMHYRKAHQYRTNRKAYEDSRPRRRRSIEGMRPMELVVGDVHPIDGLLWLTVIVTTSLR